MIPSWASWIQVILACFVGALSGGYVAAQLALSKTDESLKSELAARSIDRFVGTGGEILRDGDKVTPLGTPVLKGLGLYTIESANEMRKALLYGGTLPGITELYFAPFDQIDKRVGGGVADENIMRFANRNFKGQIQFLDINHCRIQNVAILSPMTNLRKLKIVNNPLSLNGVRALNTLNTDAFKFCCVASSVETCTPAGDEFSNCEDLMANYPLQISIWVLGMSAFCGEF